MQCKCGKELIEIGEIKDHMDQPHFKIKLGNMVLWSCPTEGCGRIYLEGSAGSTIGTWYQIEENEFGNYVF